MGFSFEVGFSEEGGGWESTYRFKMVQQESLRFFSCFRFVVTSSEAAELCQECLHLFDVELVKQRIELFRVV